jgi:D-glycero-D-manno-heptose 1,7-bisphosphate phosphatase
MTYLPAGVRAYFSDQPIGGDAPRPALFLDRDGILVEEVGYLHQIEMLRIQAGVAALIRAANQAGLPVVVVTNQSGIDRGLYAWADYDGIDREIESRLAAEGARLDARMACGYHPRFTKDWGKKREFWRKPGPGMFLYAIDRLGLAPERSWMVGDMDSDAQAARSAGLAGSFHVDSVHGSEHGDRALTLATETFAVHRAVSLSEVLSVMTEHGLFTKI